MSGKKFSELQTEIYRDLYYKSTWVYVKFQSLVEFIGKDYLLSNKATVLERATIDNLNAAGVIDYLQQHKPGHPFYEKFYSINRRANSLKHGLSSVSYDSDLVSGFITNYNSYFKNIYGINLNKYYIDPDVIQPSIKVKPSTKMSPYLSRRLMDKGATKKPETNNHSIKKTVEINCGVGNQEYGFRIIGIKSTYSNRIYNESIYATIYNFLQRSIKSKTPRYIKELEAEKRIKIRYNYVFKYLFLILNMKRYGYLEDEGLRVKLLNIDRFEFETAIDLINHYGRNIASLSKVTYCDVKLEISDVGLWLSYGASDAAFLYIEDNAIRKDDSRDIWFAPRIIYDADCNMHEEILIEFLSDFFGYEAFKAGQLKSIENTLNCQENSICILPTGGGKSIIFYINALLQPCPTIIISPTEILIKDQVRNLKELHNIDDVDFYHGPAIEKNFVLSNKFIYMTPSTLQHHKLIFPIIDYNVSHMISNIILDEIHTLCNWSHDFRPDYLMLSHNLFTFVDNCKYIGFTATANYKVLLDLMLQLSISKERIFAPVDYDAGQFDFEYIKCTTEDALFKSLHKNIDIFTTSKHYPDEKMIVFANDTEHAKRIWENLAAINNYTTALFDSKHTYSYEEFIKDFKYVLIADPDMGVGINLPQINYVTHYGYPISKAQYVQEIGRANRDNRKSQSTVIFKDSKSLSKTEQALLSFNTPIDEIISILKTSECDTTLAITMKKFLNTLENYVSSSQNIVEIYKNIKDVDNYKMLSFKINSKDDHIRVQKYLYILRTIGIIDNWYIRSYTDNNLLIQIEVDFRKDDINHVKNQAIKYLSNMGTYHKYTYDIQKATSLSEIIFLFQSWFYNEFLYYHREQLLNVVQFLNYYSDNYDIDSIKNELNNYFSISMLRMGKDEHKLLSLSMEEIWLAYNNIDHELAYLAEELMVKSYNPRLDSIMYLYNLAKHDENQITRLQRILNNVDPVEGRVVLENLYTIYGKFADQDKLDIIDSLSKFYEAEQIIYEIYSKVPFDLIYFGLVISFANNEFDKLEGF